ncbi:hypothetical protein H0H81_002573 [Sphagnurus paluster]|uniref:Uncharacterized protein n=1 Tax=Sphagnurus paluster TaxID=117069 RepID=A0A9P7GI21_9AGAR|nr:hypothetical protein H0H81_002573 [Sphagnurus paluster]
MALCIEIEMDTSALPPRKQIYIPNIPPAILPISALQFHKSPVFDKFMAGFPVPVIRPDHHFLLPIGKKEMDMALHLSSEPTLKEYTSSILRFDGRLIQWHNTCHGLAFAPSPRHEISEGKQWCSAPEFSSLFDQVRELFYEANGDLFYSGTYKCLSASQWSKEGVICTRDSVLDAIIGAPRSKNGRSAIQRCGKQKIKQLYQDGILRADSLILQCVDFNHVLYNKLLQVHRLKGAAQVPQKRKGGPPQTPGKGKAKKTKHLPTK